MTPGKALPPAQECLLASLGHPRLGGSLPGLSLVEGRLTPRPTHFSCCSGQGLRLNADASVTYVCKLGERLRETRRLAQLFAALTGTDLALTLPQEIKPTPAFGPALEILHLIAKSSRKRGLAWIEIPVVVAPIRRGASRSDDSLGLAAASPSAGRALPREDGPAAAAVGAAGSLAASGYPSMWAIALAAAWRFGLRVHIVTLSGSATGDLLPPQHKPAPDIICIARAGSFWDPHTVEKLETLVNYAYGALVPVFLQVIVSGPPPTTKARAYGKVEELIAQRLAAVRAKSPLAWLSPTCLAKLLAVTSGLTPPPTPVTEAPRQRP